MHHVEKKYLIKLFFCVIFISLPFICNFLFLKNSGEYLKTEEIYAQQNLNINRPKIYGSALFDSIKDLKFYSLNIRKPEIITLGSSRVLEFTQLFFEKKFFNMGKLISSVYDFEYIVDELTEKNNFVPHIILLGVDFWWFSSEKQDVSQYKYQNTNYRKPSHVILPLKWLYLRKITFEQYFDILLGRGSHLGVMANIYSSGFDVDGAYYNTGTIVGLQKSNDIKFLNTCSDIKRGYGKFVHVENFSSEKFEKFKSAIRKLEKNNVKVILFLPPVAPTVYREMSYRNYAYINKLSIKLKIYNLTDPHVIGLKDEDFFDGYHSGNYASGMILNFLMQKEKVLGKYVSSLAKRKENLKPYEGLVLMPREYITNKKEVDFLELGYK